MATVGKEMIQTSELRAERFRILFDDPRIAPDIHYDPDTDILRVLLVPRNTLTFVHYLDGDIAVICDVETLEVVGIHIESFQKSFLPKHPNVAREWRLGEGVHVSDMGEVLDTAERKKPAIAKEVAKATQSDLSQAHASFDLLVPA